MDLIVIETIFLAFLGLFLLWLILAKQNEKFLVNIPGPKPIPFFGNVFEISRSEDFLKTMMKFKKKFGTVYKIYAGPVKKVIVISDYKFLETVLSSNKILTKADEYHYLTPWLGTGLLTSDGRKWKKHRKILTPAFHFNILEQFIEVFEKEGKRLVEKFGKNVENSVDIYPFVTLCTLDIICETAMGTSINAQFDDDSEYVRSVKAMCKISIERIFNILQMTNVTFPLCKNYYVQKKSLSILHKQTNDVITKRRQELDGKEDQDDSIRKKTFLDLLLKASVDGRPLTQEEIREEVDTFMFEGHDTTAAAISFALYCLANNPDVQQKAYEEQLALFGKNKTPAISYSGLQSMKYLELVIKETLRLYPSVPLYGRNITDEIEFNNQIIPKGVSIAIFAYGIHRDSNYFPNPEKFDPSRFDNIDGRFPYAYIPFSAGPRNCIGQKFAMLEMKSIISRIIRHFELGPAFPESELDLVGEAVLKSLNGINITINIRK